MKKPPKFKLCRRLGGAVFSKCENPRFVAATAARSGGGKTSGARKRTVSEYGAALLDKQRVRYTYNIRERQLARYVREAAEKRGVNQADYLYRVLESRLDNIVFRLGLAKSRAAARQMVSHGHVLLNDKKVTIPSCAVRPGDRVGVRPGSADSGLFRDVVARLKEYIAPAWLELDGKGRGGKVVKEPVSDVRTGERMNFTTVLEFYGR